MLASRPARFLALVTPVLLMACTGLVANAPVQTSATVAVPRDSAWNRARRGFTAEILTIESADSIGGILVGRRYPRTTAPAEALERCHVLVHLALAPATDGTSLAWQSQWVAPAGLAAKQPPVCNEERDRVVARIQQTIAP